MKPRLLDLFCGAGGASPNGSEGDSMSFKRECDGCGALIYDSTIGGNMAPRVEIQAYDKVGDRVLFDEMCMTCWPILFSLIEHQLPMLARNLRTLGGKTPN